VLTHGGSPRSILDRSDRSESSARSRGAHDYNARVNAKARIQVLSERVRNQIAAGEVIDRPASVVKELLENALDAGARNIRIDLEEGGSRLVRIVDDGSGMSREDLELSFLAHATSKLHAVEDLDHIASLGFRGEALASMGSVARCTLLTREIGTATGNRIECEGSKLSDARETGCPEGTLVEVRDLFFNVPARRRFLKQTATELGRCLDVVQRLALARESDSPLRTTAAACSTSSRRWICARASGARSAPTSRPRSRRWKRATAM
jgi:DNA mismatch repair protein MutL